MELTERDVKELLREANEKTNDDRWIKHSICVGETARTIANELKLNGEYANILGCIHDIGKMGQTDFTDHDILGYELLKERGYDECFARICMTHSYIKGDYTCVAGGIPEEHPYRTELIKERPYNIYEEIINLCDLMCTTERMPMEKRLLDLVIRKGVHNNTKHFLEGAIKLKEEYDEYLGFDLYGLFPEFYPFNEAYLLYDTDGIHLSIYDKLYATKAKAEDRRDIIKEKEGGDWDIRTMPIV
jgi:uncharacterized domain HDIG